MIEWRVLYVTLVAVAIVVAAPIYLGRWLREHWPVGWGTFGAGTAAFVGSQLVHLPFNAWVLIPAIKHAPLGVIAVALGLSAGVFEELARFVCFRFWRKNEHTGAHALMFGAGHGGVESMWVGAMLLLGAVNLAIIQRVGVDQLGLPSEAQAALRAQLAAPIWTPLLGAFERLVTIPFHVSASCLVMLAVVRRRPAWLAAAVGWHALTDAGAVWIPAMLHRAGVSGPTAGVFAELSFAVTVPVSLWIIVRSVQTLPQLAAPRAEPRPEAAGEPIELCGVEKTFGAVQALGGVTLTIKQGERACLLGPNGAGKTTAIRIVNGALGPARGWAFLFGESSRDAGFVAAKRRVGVVPQTPGMYEEMNVRQYLELVASLYGVASFDAIAARLGLDELMDRPSHKLSGGQQRRLSLCAAMMSEPELLILDEPSAGLDPVAAREMIDLLKSVSEGRTTLLCTHNLDEAEELCDNVVILRRGKVLVHDTIANLRRRATMRVALRATQGPERLAAALRERGHAPVIDGPAVEITAPDAETTAPRLLRDLLGAGIDVYECRMLAPSLEDMFLEAVRAPESSRPAPESDTDAAREEEVA